MTKITTNLRKMRTTLDDVAQYTLQLYDVIEHTGTYYMNPLVGEEITLKYEGLIHCCDTGKPIKKTFGEGLSYDAWARSPWAVESIIRPELSRIHEGIALRDAAWEEEHHNKPHYVYLSRTNNVKVGVTRVSNLLSRWIDQGAVAGIIVAETPYRQLAGLMEVELKNMFDDKTTWKSMSREFHDEMSMVTQKEQALNHLGEAYESFFFDDDTVTHIKYPVVRFPEQLKTLKLESVPEFRGKLAGIKGQYLIFEDGHVLNIRSHAGYRISIEF